MDDPFTPLTSAETLRLWPLAVHARALRDHLHYVGYRRAERDCAALAAKLTERFGTAQLHEMQFLPIPRGGLFVLGMLAYLLDLPATALSPGEASPGQPLCLVDDVALTGYRFGQTLHHQSIAAAGQVVFAHLYSAPELREAIQAREARVTACLSARDLPVLHEKEGREKKRLDDYLAGRYWNGRARPVAFAWSEPDQLIAMPFSDDVEGGWRFVPPDRSLKNRLALDLPPLDAGDEPRTWRAPEAVTYGWFDGVLYLLQSESQQVYRLDGLVADVWRALAGYGTTGTAAEFLAARHRGLSAATIVEQLHKTGSALRKKGLLLAGE